MVIMRTTLVIKLGKSMPQYQKFKGLKCEIQLTTVLFHAWSEIQHDIIYKREKSISEFDKPTFNLLEQRFSEVMKKRIKPAQHTLDYIACKVGKIKKGARIFDSNSLRSITRSEDNNEIYEELSLLLISMKEFGDKTPKELKITDIIDTVFKNAKENEAKFTEKTHFDKFAKNAYQNIAIVCLDILMVLRFNYPVEVFNSLKPFSIDIDKRVSSKALTVAEKMVEYIHDFKKKAVICHPQVLILDEIEKLSDKDLQTYFNLIVKISKQLVFPSFKGAQKDGRKTCTYQGSLFAHDIIIEIREKAINILKKLYTLSETLSEKNQVLEALEQATRTSSLGYCSSKFRKVILKDTNTIILFYSSLVKEADNEVIGKIEEQLPLFKKRFPEGLKEVEKLEENIKKNKGYKLYGKFISYNKDQPALLFNLQKNKNRQKKEIEKCIEKITPATFPQWQKDILSVVKNYEEVKDRGQYQYFNNFLNELGKQKPEIAQQLISKNEIELKHFLSHLLLGIWQSKENKSARKILKRWIKEGKHLEACILTLEKTKEIDEPLLNDIYLKAREQSNTRALANIVYSIANNFKQGKAGKHLFTKTINELTKHKKYVDTIYDWSGRKHILKELNKKDWEIVLKNLLIASRINYNIEEILLVLAEKSPEMVIDFFFERTKIHIQGAKKEYESIPYGLYKLSKPLSQNADNTIKEILKWFDKENRSFWYRGGYFLNRIFPNFSQELEYQLIELLRLKDENKTEAVLCILNSYKGEAFLHNVCRELIRQYPGHKGYEQELVIILSRTGVSKDIIKEYEIRKERIKEWEADKNKNIREFPQKYIKHLSKEIMRREKELNDSKERKKREYEDNNYSL